MDLNEVRIKPTASVVLGSEAIFKQIGEKVKADPATAKKINAVFLYVITQGGKEAGKWSKYFDIDVSTENCIRRFQLWTWSKAACLLESLRARLTASSPWKTPTWWKWLRANWTHKLHSWRANWKSREMSCSLRNWRAFWRWNRSFKIVKLLCSFSASL